MPTVRTCPSCAQLVLGAPGACPHCGARPATPSATAAAALMGLALLGCGEKDADDSTTMDLYGVPDSGQYEDGDGDGYSPADGDCDDDNDAIHPDAEETAGDGVDSNCNDDDDT
ncbi:MAG: hypothetical protein H6740_16945 [Alphaproteobacteria bacterium]|nr:hypothetical protein [Alphaproteobacteria bacterium]